MTNEQIRIAVAELCRWTNIVPGNEVYFHMTGYMPGTTTAAIVPNYPESLDACSEFERTITGRHEREAYEEELKHVYNRANQMYDPDPFDLITAAAADRCEAFLRLKGKWIETEEKG